MASLAQKALKGTASYEVSQEEATVFTKQRSEGKGRATKGNVEEGGERGKLRVQQNGTRRRQKSTVKKRSKRRLQREPLSMSFGKKVKTPLSTGPQEVQTFLEHLSLKTGSPEGMP